MSTSARWTVVVFVVFVAVGVAFWRQLGDDDASTATTSQATSQTTAREHRDADSVEAGWAAVQPILDFWQNDKSAPLEFYGAGSPGPIGADQLLAHSRRKWRPLT